MEKRSDAFSIIPEIGEFIAYNPPRYKGTRIAKVIGFAKSGLPICVDGEDLNEYLWQIDLGNNSTEDLNCYTFTPKTGFVITKGTQKQFDEL